MPDTAHALALQSSLHPHGAGAIVAFILQMQNLSGEWVSDLPSWVVPELGFEHTLTLKSTFATQSVVHRPVAPWASLGSLLDLQNQSKMLR